VLRPILRHEVRLLLRGRVAPCALALLAIVVSYAAYAGAAWRTEQLTTAARIASHDEWLYASIRDQLLELERQGQPQPRLQLAGLPWYLAQTGDVIAPAPHLDPRRAEAAASEWVGARHAVLPPAPFSALAIGQSDLHPYYTRVTIRTRPALVQSDELENPVNLLTGRFDLAFVLAFCWPVLIMPLLYNVASEERENGTLALIGSQPIAWTRILGARLAVRIGIVWLVTLVAALLTLGALGALSDVPTGDIFGWITAVVALAAFWTGVATLINAAGWSSATNSAAMLVVWLLLVVVVPALIGEASQALVPVASRVQLITAVREAASLTAAETTALVSAYYESNPDAEPSKDSADATAIRGLAQQDEVDRRINPILNEYRASVARQQTVADRLRVLSPPLLVHDAVTELAGSTAARYRRFADEVDAYHRAWRAYFYPLVHARTVLTTAHYDRAPRFTFPEEPLGAARLRAVVLSGGTASIGMLMLFVGMRRL
jgi:ABC-2 type transport system permease protein